MLRQLSHAGALPRSDVGEQGLASGLKIQQVPVSTAEIAGVEVEAFDVG